MVERFWTLEEEDGVRGSFRTLAGTLLIAETVALVVSLKTVSQTLFRYPEALGLVMAGQLLLGRYTGYRLSELIRFREVMAYEPVTVLAFRDDLQKLPSFPRSAWECGFRRSASRSDARMANDV
jgi:7 transmembrane helices usually fused to an inactive transglutaminase